MSNKSAKKDRQQTAEPAQAKDGTSKTSSHDGNAPGGESKNAYIEAVQKRIRNLQKKRSRVEAYEEQSLTPDAAKLNQDQLNLIKSKDAQILAPLKELEEVLKVLSSVASSEGTSTEQEQLKFDERRREELKEAKESGRQEARAATIALVKFLRHAGINRQTPSGVTKEDEAFERMLAIVFEGDENAVVAAEKMADGSDDVVEGTEQVTYQRIRELAFESRPFEQPDTVQIVPDEERANAPSEEVRVPQNAINFLNASELDGLENAAPGPQAQENVQYEAPATTQIDGAANLAGTDWSSMQAQQNGGFAEENIVIADEGAAADHDELPASKQQLRTRTKGPSDFREVERRPRGRGRGERGDRDRGERGARTRARGGRSRGGPPRPNTQVTSAES